MQAKDMLIVFLERSMADSLRMADSLPPEQQEYWRGRRDEAEFIIRVLQVVDLGPADDEESAPETPAAPKAAPRPKMGRPKGRAQPPAGYRIIWNNPAGNREKLKAFRAVKKAQANRELRAFAFSHDYPVAELELIPLNEEEMLVAEAEEIEA